MEAPTEALDEFDYPIFYRIIRFLPIIMSIGVALLVLTATTLSIYVIYTGVELENVEVPTDLPTILSWYFFLALFSGLVMLNHFMFPILYVGDSGFKIGTVLYKSQLVTWEEVIAVEKHWLSNRKRLAIGIRSEKIGSVYSIIGHLQRLNGRAFIVHDKLMGFEQLLEVLQEKRPDLSIPEFATKRA